MEPEPNSNDKLMLDDKTVTHLTNVQEYKFWPLVTESPSVEGVQAACSISGHAPPTFRFLTCAAGHMIGLSFAYRKPPFRNCPATPEGSSLPCNKMLTLRAIPWKECIKDFSEYECPFRPFGCLQMVIGLDDRDGHVRQCYLSRKKIRPKPQPESRAAAEPVANNVESWPNPPVAKPKETPNSELPLVAATTDPEKTAKINQVVEARPRKAEQSGQPEPPNVLVAPNGKLWFGQKRQKPQEPSVPTTSTQGTPEKQCGPTSTHATNSPKPTFGRPAPSIICDLMSIDCRPGTSSQQNPGCSEQAAAAETPNLPETEGPPTVPESGATEQKPEVGTGGASKYRNLPWAVRARAPIALPVATITSEGEEAPEPTEPEMAAEETAERNDSEREQLRFLPHHVEICRKIFREEMPADMNSLIRVFEGSYPLASRQDITDEIERLNACFESEASSRLDNDE